LGRHPKTVAKAVTRIELGNDAASVSLELASRQVSKLGIIKGRFRRDPTSAMKKVQGNRHNEVTINPRQKIRRLDASRNFTGEKKLNERLGRWKISQFRNGTHLSIVRLAYRGAASMGVAALPEVHGLNMLGPYQ